MARSYWSGALTFAGFPISVKAYNVLAGEKKDTKLKTLCDCHGAPIKAPYLCSVDGKTDVRSTSVKGHEVSKGNYVTVDAALLNNAAPKSEAIDFAYATLIDHLSIDCAKARYRLLPGSAPFEKSVAVMWHALNDLRVALVGEWTPRNGGKDSEIAVYAAPDGLALAELASSTEQTDAAVGTAPATTVTDGESAMFKQAVNQLLGVKPYDPTRFASAWEAGRTRAIEAAIAGTPIEQIQAATPAPAVPDLMAALQASLNQTPKEAVAA
jgi:non-homologous end joining protein Ku